MSGYTISHELARQLIELLQWRRNFNVTGAASFSNTATSCMIAIANASGGGDGRRAQEIWIGQITGNAAGGGKYDAKSITGGSTAGPTGNLSVSDLGTLASSVDTLFFNLEEFGMSSHVLTDDSKTPLGIGVVIGAHEGKAIVAGISILQGCAS